MKLYPLTILSVATRKRALLDPILTSSEIQSCELGVLGVEQTVSDHSATYISVISNINYRRAYRRKIWIYKNADFTKLNTLIENCNWANIINGSETLESATENFTSKFLSYIRECITEKTIAVRPRDKPWFDSLLRKSIRIRDRLRNKALKTRNESDWSAYKKFAIQLTI